VVVSVEIAGAFVLGAAALHALQGRKRAEYDAQR
jgi:hypothetical protein